MKRVLISVEFWPLLAMSMVLAGCGWVNSHHRQAISTRAFVAKNVPARPTSQKAPTTQAARTGHAKTGSHLSAATATTTRPLSTSISVPKQILVKSAPVAATVSPGQVLSVAALLGTVNGHPIFVQDILDPVATELRHEAATSRTESYFRQRAETTISGEVHTKISNMLLYSAAHRQLSKDDRQRLKMYVQSQREKILNQYMGSVALANRQLKLAGTSLNKKLYHLQRQVTIQIYLNNLTFPQLVVTRREILRYYQTHLNKFIRHASIDLYTITYPVIRQWPRDSHDPNHVKPIAHPTPAQLAAARRKALAYCQHLESRIRQGAGFAFLAEDNSVDPQADNGGHWPLTHRGDLTNAVIEKIAFSLSPNSMAPPVLITNPHNPRRDMVVIIRVTKVQPHRVIPFSIAERAIAKTLRVQLYRKLVGRYYRHLYSTASEAALADMVRTATHVAVALYWMK